MNKIERIYFENYPDEVNGTKSLQKCCREYHGSFFSLTSFFKYLASIGKEKAKLELKFNNILQIWIGMCLQKYEKGRFYKIKKLHLIQDLI